MAGPPTGYKVITPNVKGRADFDKDRFDGMVDMFGMKCTWKQACMCPCRTLETDQPDPHCAVCRGGGVEYYNPTSIKAVFNSQTTSPDSLAPQGELWDGNAQITARAEFPIGYLDTITVNDAVMWYAETVKRKEVHPAVVPLRYPVAKRSIDYVHTQSGKVVTLSEGVDRLSIYDGRGLVLLKEGQDYIVDAEGSIDFSLGDKNGRAPKPGQSFSVRYFMNPVWVVTSMQPHPIHNIYTETKVSAPTLLHLPVTVSGTLDFVLSGRS